jgi:hypothetical protein
MSPRKGSEFVYDIIDIMILFFMSERITSCPWSGNRGSAFFSSKARKTKLSSSKALVIREFEVRAWRATGRPPPKIPSPRSRTFTTKSGAAAVGQV